MIKKIQCILKQRVESSSQSVITLQIGSVHLTDEKQLEKKGEYNRGYVWMLAMYSTYIQ